MWPIRQIRSELVFSALIIILSLSFVFNAFSILTPKPHGTLDNFSLRELILPTMNSTGSSFLSPMAGKDGTPYLSQVGLHGNVYRLLQASLDWPSEQVIILIRNVLALAFSAVLAGILIALRPVAGTAPILISAVAFALSPRLAQYSGDIYWLGVLFLLPMLLATLYARAPRGKLSYALIAGLFVAAYMKFLCGYEFITTFVLVIRPHGVVRLEC
jgi:hypothetical protein